MPVETLAQALRKTSKLQSELASAALASLAPKKEKKAADKDKPAEKDSKVAMEPSTSDQKGGSNLPPGLGLTRQVSMGSDDRELVVPDIKGLILLPQTARFECSCSLVAVVGAHADFLTSFVSDTALGHTLLAKLEKHVPERRSGVQLKSIKPQAQKIGRAAFVLLLKLNGFVADAVEAAK